MLFKEFIRIIREHDFTTGPPPGFNTAPPPVEPRPAVEPNQSKEVAKVKENLGTEYAKQFQEEDEELEKQVANLRLKNKFHDVDNASTITDASEFYGAQIESERLTYLYQNYSFESAIKNDLHINEYKPLILEQINSFTVNIIKGQTGCGKTTQVPQFILDDCRKNNIHCNIVVTQPRRIAAISVAKRVCQERNWKLGTLVGYQVGLDKCCSEDTRLLYCTTGILLEKLVASQNTSIYTHIIVDEIHERDCETDFLLILLKQLARINGITSKIILMSATVNTDKFAEYFGQSIFLDRRPAPIIELTRETRYPVLTFYIDTLRNRLPVKLPMDAFNSPQICPKMYELAASLMPMLYKIDNQESQNHNGNEIVFGSVLVFLPGIVEIETMFEVLRNKQLECDFEKWLIYPLHSTITHEEQSKVFVKTKPGIRKIILSTNIAESSITVPDVKYVIDFCLTKIHVQDTENEYSSLKMSWVSKSQAKQREGRVGRVMPGRVYRLIPEDLYKTLPEQTTPELLRSPLENIVLKAKQLNIGSPISILGRALDPPDLSNIKRTILNLKTAGALLLTTNGSYQEDDGDITLIGKIMASLPIDPYLSKLIVLGHMYGCLTESIIMACSMSVKSLFSSPFKKQLEAYSSKIVISDQSSSDPIAYLNAFLLWKHKSYVGLFLRTGGMSESDWARKCYLQIKSFHEVNRLVTALHSRLQKFNIYFDLDSVGVDNWQTSEKKSLFLKIILAGSAYPRYYFQKPVDCKEAIKTIFGNDPTKSVYVTGFPKDQPVRLYSRSIKEHFKLCGSGIKLSFDGSSKVYVSFESSITSYDEKAKMHEKSKVLTAIYRAVKMRQLNMPIIIPLLPSKEAHRRASNFYGDDSNHRIRPFEHKTVNLSILPGPSVSIVPVIITHIYSPNLFYVHLNIAAVKKKQVWILNQMQNKAYFRPMNQCELKKGVEGKICIAPFCEDGSVYYYRAKIICIFNSGRIAKVQFIDYGNSADIEVNKLFDFNDEAIDLGLSIEPPLAVQCSLAKIEPSLIKNPKGYWSNSSISAFFNHCQDSHGILYVFSVVNNVINGYLFKNNEKLEEIGKDVPKNSINHYLVSEEFANFSEESFLSLENHAIRQSYDVKTGFYGYPYVSMGFAPEFKDEPPKYYDCNKQVMLKGPFSPLESSIHSLTKNYGVINALSIDYNSINSVLLDTTMMDAKRLIVASSVTKNDASGRLTLRNTTLMPAVVGLHCLMPMIFAPKVELRVNKHSSSYIGALCGLGYDEETGSSYYDDIDMSVHFDAHFDQADIDDINKIRFWMNYMIETDNTSDLSNSSARFSHAQRRIQECTLKLVTRTRENRNEVYENLEWGNIDKERLLRPCDNNEKSVYALIDSIKLQKETLSLQEAMTEHLEELKKYADGSYKLWGEITCLLCQHVSKDVQELNVHLESSTHRKNFYYFIQS